MHSFFDMRLDKNSMASILSLLCLFCFPIHIHNPMMTRDNESTTTLYFNLYLSIILKKNYFYCLEYAKCPENINHDNMVIFQHVLIK